MTEEGRLSGGALPGPGLASGGRVEAARAADAVARVGRELWPDLPRVTEVLASPTVRAQETAAALGRRLGVHVGTEADLREIDLGGWEGRTAEEIDADAPGTLRAWHADGTVAAPGGESPAEVRARLATLLARLAADRPGRAVALVAHTVVVRAVVADALGAAPGAMSRVRVPPGGVTIVRRWPDGVSELVASGVVPG